MAFVFSNTDNELYPYLAEDTNSSGSSPNTPLSPDDQALLMGMYPGANLTDFDFSLVGPSGLQQHHGSLGALGSSGLSMGMGTSSTTLDVAASALSAGDPLSSVYSPAYFAPNQPSHAASSKLDPALTSALSPPRPHPHPTSRPTASPPTHSHLATNSNSNHFHHHSVNVDGDLDDGFDSSSNVGSGSHQQLLHLQDSEAILNAPVKSLTEEEKKLRRRAQVAKSARKHRNRQKEELAHLREQVRQLQEQMERMHLQNGNGSGSNGNESGSAPVAMDTEASCMPQRKRKKMDDESVSDIENGALQPNASKSSQAIQLVRAAPIQHFYHHLVADTEQRNVTLRQVVQCRSPLWEPFLRQEFEGQSIVQLPHMDIKLNSNGENIEVKLVSCKAIPDFTHQELAEAAWGSVFNFEVEIPQALNDHVKVEKIIDLDEHTRYGRTIAPLLKNREENYVVYMHSYLVLHQEIGKDFSLVTWETIAEDDLFPFEQSSRNVRNNEVGCVLLETETLPNGRIQSIFRAIIHSTPPIDAISQPRGRLNEAFLTVFCRNADILESSTRLYLRHKYPERFEEQHLLRGVEYVKSEDGDESPKSELHT